MAQVFDPKLIRSVSRSFSLTLLALPSSRRHSVCLAYLLARLGDTLTDAGRWSTDERLKWLSAWETAILQKEPGSWNFKASVGSFKPAEADLLLRGHELLAAYQAESPEVQLVTDELLQTLFGGMKWDLKTFGSAQNSKIIWGCKDSAIFDWYCFSVAGCVGRYWVKIFGLPANLELLATEYGRGLQRINILRDVREDFDRGRVYLPISSFEEGGDSKAPWDHEDWESIIDTFVAETRAKLLVGANFCDAIPYAAFRLRLASSLPLKIGMKTLALLEVSKFWDEKRVKIARSDVRNSLIESGFDIVFGRKLSARYRG